MRLWRTPLGGTLWIMGGQGGTYTPYIVACALLKVKKHEVTTIKRQKKSKKSNRNIKNRDAPILKLATNGLEVFVNAFWASFYAMDVSSNIKLRLLLMHKYCT